MRKKRIAAFLTGTFLLSMFTGFSYTTKISSAAGPFGKYSQPVTVTMGRPDVQGSNLPSGDSMSSNLFLKTIKDDLNINVEYSWLGSATDTTQYDDKVNLAIASGSIPDVMYVDNQNQLAQLIQAGLLEDLKPAYDSTASNLIKVRYNSLPSDLRFAGSMSKGKLYALPNVNINYQYTEMWVRKDWMKKVGAKAPKSLNDVINLAKTFMQKDPGGNGKGNTIGIVANPQLAGIYNGQNCLDSIFGSFGSYPKQWVKNASGNYTYGSTSAQTQKALAAIASMYKAGVIDPQFAVRSSDDENSLLISGKCGITFGPWWDAYYPLNSAQKNNPSSDWEAFLAPLATDGNYYEPTPNPHTNWIVVKKGMKNPEAVIKILNLEYQGIKQEDPKVSNVDPGITKLYDGLGVMWGVWPLPIQVEFWNENLMDYSALSKAWATKSTKGLTFQQTQFYNDFVKQNANPGKDNNAWQTWTARYMAEGLMAKNQKIVKFPSLGFPPVTKTMQIKWANLQTLESQAFLKIVMGQEPITYFNTFVSQWKQQGGDQITKEVNQALK